MLVLNSKRHSTCDQALKHAAATDATERQAREHTNRFPEHRRTSLLQRTSGLKGTDDADGVGVGAGICDACGHASDDLKKMV